MNYLNALDAFKSPKPLNDPSFCVNYSVLIVTRPGMNWIGRARHI